MTDAARKFLDASLFEGSRKSRITATLYTTFSWKLLRSILEGSDKGRAGTEATVRPSHRLLSLEEVVALERGELISTERFQLPCDRVQDWAEEKFVGKLLR